MPSPFDAPVAAVQPLFEGPVDLIGDVHGEWLALQRADLRVTHAAWDRDALASMAADSPRSHLDRYADYESDIAGRVGGDVADAVREELRRWGEHLHDPELAVPLLPALAFADETYQMGNPLRVLTSGVERRAPHSFFASGKWRMVARVPWWQEYAEPTPVVIGHYWRWLTPEGRARYGHGAADLFGGTDPLAWLGPAGKVFCVDYSVGARFRERVDGHEPGSCTTLAALRWPECELVTETGRRFPASGR